MRYSSSTYTSVLQRTSERRSTFGFRRRTSSRAFTLVETLVAITILMIAVAGPLVVATRGLTSASVAKNQMVATFLAQETLEVIKNRRDNDTDLGSPGTGWLVVDNLSGQVDLLQCIKPAAGSDDTPCDAGLLSENEYIVTGCEYLSPVDTDKKTCRLFFNEAAGYIPAPNNGSEPDFFHSALGLTFTPSSFYRHFYVEIADGDETNPTEVTLHVKVHWMEGRLPYEIHLTSQLVNVVR